MDETETQPQTFMFSKETTVNCLHDLVLVNREARLASSSSSLSCRQEASPLLGTKGALFQGSCNIMDKSMSVGFAS